MKNLCLFLSVSFLFLCSCNNLIPNNSFEDAFPNESFVDLDFTKFNTEIKDARYITNAGALMELYYPYKVNKHAEGNESVTITRSVLKNGFHKTVMIHDRMLDDSQRGIQIIMIAKENNGLWEVVKLKKNWRCQAGRGHEGWGTKKCS